MFSTNKSKKLLTLIATCFFITISAGDNEKLVTPEQEMLFIDITAYFRCMNTESPFGPTTKQERAKMCTELYGTPKANLKAIKKLSKPLLMPKISNNNNSSNDQKPE